MNDLSTIDRQLPDTLEDLATWDKFLSARLPTYRKLLHGVKSWEEASEEEKRILRRAQEESENLIDIRVKIGELYKAIPEDRTGRPEKNECNGAPTFTQKQSFKQQSGLSDDQAKRYVKMASHPEAVEAAKADARERNDVVSQQSIMRTIAAESPPSPKKKDNSFEAKLRHKGFEQKKSDSVVSIEDIRQDKDDRKMIAEGLYKDLRSWTNKGGWIGALNNSETFNSLVAVIPNNEAHEMAERIRKCFIVLEKLMEVLSEK